MIIKITKKTAGIRLDKFLAGASLIWNKQALSRSRIQNLIKQNIIKINGLPAVSHYWLKPSDMINIQKRRLRDNQPAKKNVSAELSHEIKIIAETDEFLVVNKPAGLAAHGTTGYTLADWLKNKYPTIKTVGDDPARPGIVHRLDKDVSGLMVIAKTTASFERLKKQFQTRTVIKEYTALVHGQIQKDSGLINFPIKRSREGYKMAALPLTLRGEPATDGRLAETEFRVIAKLINYTLLKLKIRTGRTHQIRVHLAAYDHPVVGDNVYGTAKTRTQNRKLDLKRIFLMADHLCFNDSNNQPRDFKIDLTEELKNILKVVK
ncbi:hypothetical protein A3H09_01970 [Candidatus Falkowbacteria bacterium RIFCSPLOWO2_12_FULL_45_13]|uniref:Pseudouridine synthase n=2 Tax=Candidatus Falkowiibacteriota TaxID=1752728 RepID=A0A1F5SCR0_9BACT|nr:MAG: hypothetical protein A3H66_00025 [Candidatus Falkowbacteria bacterium RIFCSPLOWO2_02_FULL_45_21]OGF30142.1 MAG: hypothetical protein A3H09_01970 [Candidatus Falkowbacteria bacterium RIFCSPLOWO2_12_FULL_45_13]